ncbi:MAG: hypothetical protein RLY43_1997, partial [Bacteroidota bacterium]
MGKIVRVKKGNQEFDVEESKLPLAIKDGFQPIGKPEKLYTVVKGDKEFDVKESLLSQAEADGFKKKSGTTTVSATPEKTTQEPTSSSQPFTPTKSPLGVQSPFVGGSVVPTDIFNQPQVQEIGSETPLSINPRSIPVTPYATPEAYVNSLQQRINTGKLTNQDKAVLDRNKRGKFFNGQDDAELSKLSSKYGAEIQSGDFESKLAAIDKIKNKIQNNIANEKVDYKSIIGVSGIERPTSADSKYDFELDALENMRDKLIREKAVREPYEKYQSATARTDEGGSWLNQIGNFASNYFTPTGATGGFAGTRDASYQVKDQPAELSI